MNEKYKTAIALFDQANSKDPFSEEADGKLYPKELLYAMRMSAQLEIFEPTASEVVKLAVRCQHICRWEIPRNQYEMTRIGYLKWRSELAKFHAQKAGELLQQAGYEAEVIAKVQFLLQKKQLKKNRETQLLEDVICLVFLKYYIDKFSKKYNEQKLIEILKKTWNKMSEAGQEAALEISYQPHVTALLTSALNEN